MAHTTEVPDNLQESELRNPFPTIEELIPDANDSTTIDAQEEDPDGESDEQDDPPPPKRKRGRPRKTATKRGRNAARQTETPTEPADTDDEHELAMRDDIFYWLDNLSDEMWTGLTVYVYRKEPVWLQDKTGGKPHFIQKMSMRFNADDLKRMHGSGIYRMDVTSALAVGGSRRLKKGDVHILDPNYPPNLPVSDAWTKNPINSKWFWAIPILEKREQGNIGAGQPATSSRANTAPASVPGPGPADDDGLVGLARRSQEQLMQLSDPRKQLDTVQQIIQMVKPPQDGGNTALFAQILDMLKEQNRELRQEIRDLRNQPRETKDAATLIRETIELADVLGYKKGGKETKPDPWASFFEKVMDNAPLIAEIIVNGPQKPQPQIESAPEPPEQEAEPQQQEQQRMQPTAEEQAMHDRAAAFEPIIRNSIGPMIEAVRAKQPQALRRWFLEEYGRQNFEAIKREIGAERMAHMATTHTVLKLQLPGKPEMQTFFEQVFE